MPASFWKHSLLFITILIMAACGEENFSGGTRTFDPPEEEEAFPTPLSFNTRISPTLLIAGIRCRGGETTEYNNQTYTCLTDQYLITLDYLNTCGVDGGCTEIFVPPIVGALKRAGIEDPDFAIWDMSAVSPVIETQDQLLKSYRVKSDELGNGVVIPIN